MSHRIYDTREKRKVELHPLVPGKLGLYACGITVYDICHVGHARMLVAFDVINLRNRAVYQISTFLDRVTGPVLRPFQRIIPPLGGVDISPIIVLLIITAVQRFILRDLENALLRLVGYY